MKKALLAVSAILLLAALAAAQAPPPGEQGPGQWGQGPGQWGPQRRMMGPGMGQGMGPGMRPGMRQGMGQGMGPGMGRGMRPMRRGPGFGPRQMEALNLTAEQRNQFKQLHFSHGVANEKLHSDMRIKRMELQQLMSADSMDRAKVDAKMKELSDLRLQAQKSRLDQREAMMKILTPEQKDKLKTLGPGGPGGPGRGFQPQVRRPGPPQEEQQ